MIDEATTTRLNERGLALQSRHDALYAVASRAWDRSRPWHSVSRWGFFAELVLVFLTGLVVIGCAICSATPFLFASIWMAVALSKAFLSCFFVGLAVAWVIERPARASQSERDRISVKLQQPEFYEPIPGADSDPVMHFS